MFVVSGGDVIREGVVRRAFVEGKERAEARLLFAPRRNDRGGELVRVRRRIQRRVEMEG